MPTLYITEPGARLEIGIGRLEVWSPEDDLLFSAPANRVSGVVAVGNVAVTTPAMRLMLARGIDLFFLTRAGAYRGRLQAGPAKNLERRRTQVLRCEDEAFCLELSKRLVTAKLENCRTIVMRRARGKEDAASAEVARLLRRVIGRIPEAHTRTELRGMEGISTRHYFGLLGGWLREPWAFERRQRRPPKDPVNATLSLVYTLLHGCCVAALETVSLDPYFGVYHTRHYGRESLAVDLMEEFRPVIADAVVLELFNRRMLSPVNFETGEDGAVELDREGWRQVARAWTRRLETTARPPGIHRSITYQKILEYQARKLQRAITGDTPYEPFLIK